MKDFINKVVIGDCMKILKNIPDNSIAGCVTDPPYNYEFIGRDWNQNEIERRVERSKLKNSSTLVKIFRMEGV